MHSMTRGTVRERVARLGLFAFAFFFLKGMVWLIAGWALVRGVT